MKRGIIEVIDDKSPLLPHLKRGENGTLAVFVNRRVRYLWLEKEKSLFEATGKRDEKGRMIFRHSSRCPHYLHNHEEREYHAR